MKKAEKLSSKSKTSMRAVRMTVSVKEKTDGSGIAGAPARTGTTLWDADTNVPAVDELLDGGLSLPQELELEI